jgi:hypothetical protein
MAWHRMESSRENSFNAVVRRMNRWVALVRSAGLAPDKHLQCEIETTSTKNRFGNYEFMHYYVRAVLSDEAFAKIKTSSPSGISLINRCVQFTLHVLKR